MLDVFFIRKIAFPRSANLWIALDRRGLRLELLERGDRLGRRVGPLDRLNAQIQAGGGKYPTLQAIELTSQASSTPAWLGFDAWLAEMIEVGLAHDDPHPELFELLANISRRGGAPAASDWGQAAMHIGGIFGVWSPPETCQCDNAGRDPRRSHYYCQNCATTAPKKMLTLCGNMQVPLALLLDDLDRAFHSAFDKSLASANFIRQLGQRGLLAA